MRKATCDCGDPECDIEPLEEAPAEVGHIDWCGCDSCLSKASIRQVRQFASGATRDTEANKIDPEAYFSPQVFRAYCEYMRSHQTLPDGTQRSGDNWQAGIPRDAYMKSMWRHFMDVWENHRDPNAAPIVAERYQQDALCALLFNVMGYLHEVLEGRSAQ